MSKDNGERHSTGFKDRKGTPIHSGDILCGWFNAPWDEEVPVLMKFTVRRVQGQYMCCGQSSNHEDDFLESLAPRLTVSPHEN